MALPDERWADTVGWFSRYTVSSCGRIWSLKTKRMLKLSVNARGYAVASLFRNNKATYVRVHRAVALAFIANPKSLPTVNHKNGIKTDNRVENLEWATKEDQMRHSVHVLRKGCGGSGSGRKLTVAQVTAIRLRHVRGIAGRGSRNGTLALATEFGVTPNAILHITRRLSWIYE